MQTAISTLYWDPILLEGSTPMFGAVLQESKKQRAGVQRESQAGSTDLERPLRHKLEQIQGSRCRHRRGFTRPRRVKGLSFRGGVFEAIDGHADAKCIYASQLPTIRIDMTASQSCTSRELKS